jgi:hypothetical protein
MIVTRDLNSGLVRINAPVNEMTSNVIGLLVLEDVVKDILLTMIHLLHENTRFFHVVDAVLVDVLDRREKHRLS